MIDIKLTYVQEEFTVVLVSGLCYDKNAVAGAGAGGGGGAQRLSDLGLIPDR